MLTSQKLWSSLPNEAPNVTYFCQSDLKYAKKDLKLGKNDLKYYDLKWDFPLGGLLTANPYKTVSVDCNSMAENDSSIGWLKKTFFLEKLTSPGEFWGIN